MFTLTMVSLYVGKASGETNKVAVGGRMLELALDNMKEFGRIVICGDVSGYNTDKPHGIKVFPLHLNPHLSLTVLNLQPSRAYFHSPLNP